VVGDQDYRPWEQPGAFRLDYELTPLYLISASDHHVGRPGSGGRTGRSPAAAVGELGPRVSLSAAVRCSGGFGGLHQRCLGG
jgi:hypothetical protein